MLGLVLGATVAYVVIEGYTWLDALYMTVITLGTIGYGEVEPLTQVGLSQLAISRTLVGSG